MKEKLIALIITLSSKIAKTSFDLNLMVSKSN
jgi:hypothetical protein